MQSKHTFPLNGFVITRCWSSEPDKICWPVSFQHMVFTYMQKTLITIL